MLLLWLCYYMCCIFVECVLVYLLRLVTISLLELDHLTYLVVAYVLMGVEIEVNKNTNNNIPTAWFSTIASRGHFDYTYANMRSLYSFYLLRQLFPPLSLSLFSTFFKDLVQTWFQSCTPAEWCR